MSSRAVMPARRQQVRIDVATLKPLQTVLEAAAQAAGVIGRLVRAKVLGE